MSLRAPLASAVKRRKERAARRGALAFYRRFVRRGDLCFDVGANVGNRTELFLALGAHVVAVEPQPTCAEALRSRFASASVEVVQAALGEEPGSAAMMVASYHTLSSLSDRWVGAVQSSGRFDEFTWDGRLTVDVTTLDLLIARFGVPRFVKVDVEGFEYEVVRGLSNPVAALCFEFTPECFDTAREVVCRLEELGMRRFNFSWGESLRLALPAWVDGEEILAFLRGPRHGVSTFGDVYAKT